MDRQHWQTFADPRFEVTFSFPAVTPDDHPVMRAEEQAENMLTIRLTADEKRAMYFEVTKFADADAKERYAKLHAQSQQHPAELSVTALTEAELAGCPAYTFELTRGELHRQVWLVQRGSAFYRITYDPHAPLNTQMLATIAFGASSTAP